MLCTTTQPEQSTHVDVIGIDSLGYYHTFHALNTQGKEQRAYVVAEAIGMVNLYGLCAYKDLDAQCDIDFLDYTIHTTLEQHLYEKKNGAHMIEYDMATDSFHIFVDRVPLLEVFFCLVIAVHERMKEKLFPGNLQHEKGMFLTPKIPNIFLNILKASQEFGPCMTRTPRMNACPFAVVKALTELRHTPPTLKKVLSLMVANKEPLDRILFREVGATLKQSYAIQKALGITGKNIVVLPTTTQQLTSIPSMDGSIPPPQDSVRKRHKKQGVQNNGGHNPPADYIITVSRSDPRALGFFPNIAHY
jgi:hypothetical protein